MKVFVCLFLVALAIAAEAGMMGPPGGMGGGGPPGGPGMGPPPFVQAIIAGKGKPFGPGAAGGPPGGFPGAAGPPPFVQAIIAGKGKPFGPPAAAPAPAPEPVGYGSAADPLGPPAFIQSLLAAKAASAYPFMPPSIPLGPPAFVQQLIAAKNAAAAQQAAEEAAMMAQLQAAQQMEMEMGGRAASPVYNLFNTVPGQSSFGMNAFAPNIIPQTGSPSGTTSPGGALPSDFFHQLLRAQLAKQSQTDSANISIPSFVSGAQPNGISSGGWGHPAQSGLGERRDLVATDGRQQQMAPLVPGIGAYQPYPMGYPNILSPFAPMPYPMMPFIPNVPMWN